MRRRRSVLQPPTESYQMGSTKRVAILAMALSVGATTWVESARAATSNHQCQITSIIFHGWHAQRISNDWVQLTIVPQLGGRLMQASFGGHDFLFVNPKYQGKYISPTEAAGSWINYGGDKIWPLPEGDEDDHHWSLKSDLLEANIRSTSRARESAALGRSRVSQTKSPDCGTHER